MEDTRSFREGGREFREGGQISRSYLRNPLRNVPQRV
jgi:hypothetical protein